MMQRVARRFGIAFPNVVSSISRPRASSVRSRARKSSAKIAVLAALALASAVAYLLIDVNFGNERLFAFAMSLRVPKLAAMFLSAFAIGAASIVFQSVINNNIVTPCLLGMNSLYTLVHTALAFFVGTGSFLMTNGNVAFAIDLVVMSAVAMTVYGHLFKLTNYNILYILLIGTVLTSLFGSVQSTLVRVMDPNEYDTLLTSLVASFSNVNAEILAFSSVLLVAIALLLRKEIALLDVITLGKDQATSLGVDYDRTVRRLLLGVVLYISIATAMVGPISFLGLIVANLSRELLKTYRRVRLIVAAALFGTIALVAGQCAVEHAFGYVVPVSTFVTIAGGLYFLYLILRTRKA